MERKQNLKQKMEDIAFFKQKISELIFDKRNRGNL